MKEKKPFYRKWWFWLLIVSVFLIIASNLNKDNTQNTDASPQDSSVATEETSTEATLESLVTQEHEDWKEFETTDEGYQIQYKDTSLQLSETTLVNDAIDNYVKISKAIYDQNPSCKYVKIFIFVDMQDSKGNVSQSQAVRISMTQEEFNTFNWDNLKNTKIYDSFTASCDDFFIESSIASNVKTDKIFLH